MLNMVLNDQIEDNRGLRQHSEIEKCVNESIEIKSKNPAEDYKILNKLGAGEYGLVFKAQRMADG